MNYEGTSNYFTHTINGLHRSQRDVKCANPMSFRIGLRLWGFDETQVRSWSARLPTLGGRLSWEIAHDSGGDGASMLIHLVKSSSETFGPFCWNCVGANRAILRAQGQSAMHVAVFSGDSRRLPALRHGLWAMAERGIEEETLHEIARTLVIPRVMLAR